MISTVRWMQAKVVSFAKPVIASISSPGCALLLPFHLHLVRIGCHSPDRWVYRAQVQARRHPVAAGRLPARRQRASHNQRLVGTFEAEPPNFAEPCVFSLARARAGSSMGSEGAKVFIGVQECTPVAHNASFPQEVGPHHPFHNHLTLVAFLLVDPDVLHPGVARREPLRASAATQRETRCLLARPHVHSSTLSSHCRQGDLSSDAASIAHLQVRC